MNNIKKNPLAQNELSENNLKKIHGAAKIDQDQQDHLNQTTQRQSDVKQQQYQQQQQQ